MTEKTELLLLGVRQMDTKGKIKLILAILIIILGILCTAFSAFLVICPIRPKVTIKSAEERIKVNDEIVAASFNTAAPWGNLIKGTYSTRRASLFAQEINDNMPDTLGVQEMNSDWVKRMETYLPQYAYYGVKRGGDSSEKTSEMSGIFYLKDKFNLLDSGTFWISETPQVESHYEGAGCNRICSYIVLENKETKFRFVHFNTHFDNVSEKAQALGGELISEYAQKIAEKYENIPVVITGDFNQYSDGAGCISLEQRSFKNVGKALGKDNLLTYNAWTKETEGQPIDFIFINDRFCEKDYSVIHYEKGTNTSDHYMITATLNFSE